MDFFFLQRNLLETKEAIERQRKLLKKRQPGKVFPLNHMYFLIFPSLARNGVILVHECDFLLKMSLTCMLFSNGTRPLKLLLLYFLDLNLLCVKWLHGIPKVKTCWGDFQFHSCLVSWHQNKAGALSTTYVIYCHLLLECGFSNICWRSCLIIIYSCLCLVSLEVLSD